MIKIIKCINSNFPNSRPDKICSSIIGRTAAWYQKEGRTDIVFIEKNTFKDKEWLKENNINSYPTLLFYKDGELKYKRHHIMAQAQIMEVIENL
jgi:hypothetical protein